MTEKPTPKSSLRLVVAIIVIALAIIIIFWSKKEKSPIVIPHPPRPLSFYGDSNSLSQTQIVPTLDTPTPSGINVIWCLSFQLAWDVLKNDIIKQPVEVANAVDISQRLNQATASAKDIRKESYYARAGLVEDDIHLKIQQDMAKRFPDVDVSDLKPDELTVIIAYAYLEAAVNFEIPFLDYDQPFQFCSSDDKEKTTVEAFGIWDAHTPEQFEIQEQVDILYFTFPKNSDRVEEFVIDPSKHTKPYQVILAAVPWQVTLQETIAYAEAKIKTPMHEIFRKLGGNDELLMPRMAWKLRHHFSELEGEDKLLNKSDLYIAKAIQDIEFHLDRTGVEVKSLAKISVEACQPRHFIFDKPFLIYMKIRGHDKPFFAMWVENAELLYPTKD